MEDLAEDKENIRLEKVAIGIPCSPSSVNMAGVRPRHIMPFRKEFSNPIIKSNMAVPKFHWLILL